MGKRYETDVRVRFSDLDALGHVNNARVLTLLEEARVDWLWADAAKNGLEGLVNAIVVARQEIDYLRPILFGNPVQVDIGVTRIGGASFAVDYELRTEGELAVRAMSVLVPIDLAAGRPRRLTDVERNYLAEFSAG